MWEDFAASIVVKPFKWAGHGGILIDVKFNDLVAKAVYDSGYVSVAISKYFI